MSAKDYKEALQQKEEEVKQFREVNKKIEVMVFKDGSSRLNFFKGSRDTHCTYTCWTGPQNVFGPKVNIGKKYNI